MSSFQILGGEDYVPFITDINVRDLGQTVTIKCSGDPENNLTYQVICSKCEKVEVKFNENLASSICDNGIIDVVEFSTGEESSNKKFIYL
ncbi:MAG: hypothetical protein HC930_06960 [Hydrococcus sp. SU_1_0]|nr:hypothetical protein [Hydrococcus sp. SU_1_0]